MKNLNQLVFRLKNKASAIFLAMLVYCSAAFGQGKLLDVYVCKDEASADVCNKVSIRYSERLAEAGIEPSVGSRGDSYDNALAETINGLYKTEVVHRRGPWKTKESLELATLQWVHWFNHCIAAEMIAAVG